MERELTAGEVNKVNITIPQGSPSHPVSADPHGPDRTERAERLMEDELGHFWMKVPHEQRGDLIPRYGSRTIACSDERCHLTCKNNQLTD